MFERFTGSARKVVVLAQEEARRLHHPHIGTEHLLLGLLREGGGLAGQALVLLNVSLDESRTKVAEFVPPGAAAPPQQIPFTPQCKVVLERSLRESLRLRHDYIGTEHILLGLVQEEDGLAAQVLVELAGDLARIDLLVRRMLNETGRDEAPSPATGLSRQDVAALAERLAVAEKRLEIVEGRLGAAEQRLEGRPDGAGRPDGRIRGDSGPDGP